MRCRFIPIRGAIVERPPGPPLGSVVGIIEQDDRPGRGIPLTTVGFFKVGRDRGFLLFLRLFANLPAKLP